LRAHLSAEVVEEVGEIEALARAAKAAADGLPAPTTGPARMILLLRNPK
jgi:hypothetical protein